MTEINLLPEELRKSEEKEMEVAKKKSKSADFELTKPKLDDKSAVSKPQRPSLLSRLFGKKKSSTQKSRPLKINNEEEEERRIKPKTDKSAFHIPEAESKDSLLKVDFGHGLDLTNQVDIKKTKEKSTPDESEKEEKKNKFSLAKLFFRKTKSQRVKDKKEADQDNQKGEQRHKFEKHTLNVDLIPEEMSKHPELELSKKLFISGMIILLSVVLVGAVYLGITWYQLNVNNKLEELTTEIAGLEKEVAVYENKKDAAVSLQKRLTVIRGILDSHLYWTNFFELLENNTIPEVYYTNFSMAGTERVVLSAVGRDYESVAKQLVVFQQATDFVVEARVDAASANLDEVGDYESVDFNISLVFKPGVFKKPIE